MILSDGMAFARLAGMTEQITIHPLPEANLSPYQARMAKAPEIVNNDFFGSFADMLDVINPLQHIPGVATLYREMTGNGISTGAKLAGDALFGGPIGLVASLIGSIMEQETGKDIGGHMFAAATDKYKAANIL